MELDSNKFYATGWYKMGQDFRAPKRSSSSTRTHYRNQLDQQYYEFRPYLVSTYGEQFVYFERLFLEHGWYLDMFFGGRPALSNQETYAQERVCYGMGIDAKPLWKPTHAAIRFVLHPQAHPDVMIAHLSGWQRPDFKPLASELSAEQREDIEYYPLSTGDSFAYARSQWRPPEPEPAPIPMPDFVKERIYNGK